MTTLSMNDIAVRENAKLNAERSASTESSITRSQIRALSDEAANAGDLEQVAICERALAGDADAIRLCGRVITNTAAQLSEGPEGGFPGHDDDA